MPPADFVFPGQPAQPGFAALDERRERNSPAGGVDDFQPQVGQLTDERVEPGFRGFQFTLELFQLVIVQGVRFAIGFLPPTNSRKPLFQARDQFVLGDEIRRDLANEGESRIGLIDAQQLPWQFRFSHGLARLPIHRFRDPRRDPPFASLAPEGQIV